MDELTDARPFCHASDGLGAMLQGLYRDPPDDITGDIESQQLYMR